MVILYYRKCPRWELNPYEFLGSLPSKDSLSTNSNTQALKGATHSRKPIVVQPEKVGTSLEGTLARALFIYRDVLPTNIHRINMAEAQIIPFDVYS